MKVAGLKHTHHKGPARVFDCEEDAFDAVQRHDYKEGDVIVIRYEGPKGGPGMREMLSTTAALYGQGTENIAADAGPIGLIRNGDIITIDADKGLLEVDVSEAEFAERRKAWKPRKPAFKTGVIARYAKNVGPARYGALTTPGADEEVRCYADI